MTDKNLLKMISVFGPASDDNDVLSMTIDGLWEPNHSDIEAWKAFANIRQWLVSPWIPLKNSWARYSGLGFQAAYVCSADGEYWWTARVEEGEGYDLPEDAMSAADEVLRAAGYVLAEDNNEDHD